MNIFNNPLFDNIRKAQFENWIILLLFSTLLLSCDSNDQTKYDRPFVYLNHIYVTVDSSTYSDIFNSDYIAKKFANITTKTIKADSNESWTGTYIFGQNTYIEIFNSGNEINLGHSGIAFGTEICGGVDSLYKSSTDSQRKYLMKELRHLRTEAGEIPWFYHLYSTKEDSHSILSSWVMEYLPEYVKYKLPEIESESIDITRQLYNHKSYNKDLLFKDIIEVELALNEFDRKKLYEELTLYGYNVEQVDDKLIGKGPNIIIIILDESSEKSGICRIKFMLNNNKYSEQTIDFGNKAKLILNPDKTAEWHFRI